MTSSEMPWWAWIIVMSSFVGMFGILMLTYKLEQWLKKKGPDDEA